MSIEISKSHNLVAKALDYRAMRQDMIASNIANADTMESNDGGPYRRKSLSLKSNNARGFSEIFSTQLEKTTTSSTHFKQGFNHYQDNLIGSGVKVASIKENGDFTTIFLFYLYNFQ